MWLIDIAPRVNAIYTWLLMVVGFVTSILLGRALKSRGFYLVAVFFLSPICSWGFKEAQYLIHREALDAYAAEQRQRVQAGETLPQIESAVQIPLFETFLVIGLGISLRASRAQNHAPEPTRSGAKTART